ncbi:Tol-Pal system beta propeller repeat protein TolB [Acuticoccus sp. I52.16.1]|uniref:Tol-Pal system beta propeller repeat protein TolB n=1 Tax=Acuticoccus sp. I52.16.1 TaxID=2928472 RepID=UPI001FD32BEC|nr:Tol-Pal system beta propeller repeat protein TolB [Acuticoccus sp. I52.16.1]UOM32832.1 Tol-Pal system beta propeller repeat protein TolB [Acuticoccus sp. I52.16.1]
MKGVLMLSRIRLFLAALATMAALSSPASALVSIEVTGGDVRPLPIAVPYFASADPTMGQQIADVVMNDLVSSGLFAGIDRTQYSPPTLGVEVVPAFANWRAIGAEALVSGTVIPEGGQLRVEFRLWDPLQEQQVVGQQFTTTPDNWRRVAHIVADAIYERLTGESGYFDTRIVFVAESGPKNARVKRLAIMDQDGYNLTYLTDGSTLVLTPRFSPAGQYVTYMSYEGAQPQVFLLDVETGRRQLLSKAASMSFAPRFSPDGSTVVMSIQEGGNSNIFAMSLQGGQPRRLTNTPAIDTAPSYSPDGRQIVFESDRGGSQQLYVMNADGSGQQRISYGDGRYSTPVWSPKGDLIAFTKQAQGRFAIGVMNPDGSGERILTSGFHNEGPTWAPNGRVIAFFRDAGGPQGGPGIWTVNVTGRNERQLRLNTMASDPAWSPLRR